MSTGTTTPVTLSSFFFSVLDIDEGNSNSVGTSEKAEFENFVSYEVGSNVKVNTNGGKTEVRPRHLSPSQLPPAWR